MTIFYVGVAAVVIGAGLSAYSASEQASAQKKQLKYQADVAKNNAKIAEWQRSLTLQDAENTASNRMRQGAELRARQKTALASHNVATEEGSALDILATTDFDTQMDVANIQTSAARAAWGYENEGKGLTNEANFRKNQSANISPAKEGAIAGASSLLSSAASYGLSKG